MAFARPLQTFRDRTIVSTPGTMQSRGCVCVWASLLTEGPHLSLLLGHWVKRILMYVPDNTGLGQQFLSLYGTFCQNRSCVGF